MGDVTPIRRRQDPSPMETWPGKAIVNRKGVALALEMLVQLEENDQDEHGIPVADRACLEDWPREGRPFINVVAEYLKVAREQGPDVEAGFCAVLTDIVGLVFTGTAPTAERYSAEG